MPSSVERAVARLEELADAQDAAFRRGDVPEGARLMDSRAACLRELEEALRESPAGEDAAGPLRRARRRCLLTRRLVRHSLGETGRELAQADLAASRLPGSGVPRGRSRHLDCTG